MAWDRFLAQQRDVKVTRQMRADCVRVVAGWAATQADPVAVMMELLAALGLDAELAA